MRREDRCNLFSRWKVSKETRHVLTGILGWWEANYDTLCWIDKLDGHLLLWPLPCMAWFGNELAWHGCDARIAWLILISAREDATREDATLSLADLTLLSSHLSVHYLMRSYWYVDIVPNIMFCLYVCLFIWLMMDSYFVLVVRGCWVLLLMLRCHKYMYTCMVCCCWLMGD